VKGAVRHVRIAAVALTAVSLVAWPGVVRACSVCFVGRGEETRAAFLNTTIVLSLLPLLAVGGMVWWLMRRVRALEAITEDGAATSADSAKIGS
jgi:uncharacterized membrane protein YphA (DoxX/SURF4 family)